MELVFASNTADQEPKFPYEAHWIRLQYPSPRILSLEGKINKVSGIEKEWHSFMAALIMGYYVFGENNAVNMQVTNTEGQSASGPMC